MKLEEALAIVRQACAAFVGNLGDHQKIQQALALIEQELQKPAVELALAPEEKKK